MSEMPEGGMDHAAMMAEWAKWMTPGEPHALLQKAVGTWNCKMRMTCGGPDSEIMENDGKATFESMYDGRFLVQRYEGTMMGMPYLGMGIEGYDNYRKEYVTSWYSNMATSVTTMRGQYDAAAKQVNYAGLMDEPLMDMKDKKIRATASHDGDDKMTFTMFDTLPDGSEYTVFTIDYVRA